MSIIINDLKEKPKKQVGCHKSNFKNHIKIIILSRTFIIKRYAAKLLSVGLQTLLSIITLGIIPRALGPTFYGYVGYLNTFFPKLLGAFQIGFPRAFYIKFSKNQSDKKMVGYFIAFLTFLSILLPIITLILFATNTDHYFFKNIDIGIVFGLMVYAILNFINSCIRNINDALGLTIFYEKIAIGSSIIFSLTILLTSKYDTLNVGLYILILCLIATATLFLE